MTATRPLSIVIPTLDEAKELPATLAALAAVVDDDAGIEVVVADGRSRDASVSIARRHGARVVVAEPGRASQMNAGARAGTGDPLLFLHADTRIGGGHVAELRRALRDPRVSHGSFAIALDAKGMAFRVIEAAANLRTRLDRTPYGDQAMFVRRAAFDAVGGFPEVPIMEDVMLARALRATGRFVLLGAPPVRTSARRWRRAGLVRTTLLNGLTRLLWEVGVSPRHLRRLYDRANRATGVSEPDEDPVVTVESER